MSKRGTAKPIGIEISLEDLHSLGQQLDLERGPLSPLLEAKTGAKPEPVVNSNLVSKKGKVLKSVLPVFEVLAKPEIALSVILIAPETIIDVALFSRADNGEGQSVALYKGQEKLWLHSPAPKGDILGMLFKALGSDHFRETSIELDTRTSHGAAWVLWSLMDLMRPIDGVIPGEAQTGFSSKQILDLMNAEVAGLWNLAAHYRHALELPAPKKDELEGWCTELVEKAYLEKSRNRWKPALLLRSTVENLFPLRSLVHFKMSAQAPSVGIGSMRFWGLQAESGTCLLWHTLTEETQLLSTGTWNLMAILQKLIDQPEFVMAPETIQDLAASNPFPSSPEKLDSESVRPGGLPDPPEHLLPGAPPETL